MAMVRLCVPLVMADDLWSGLCSLLGAKTQVRPTPTSSTQFSSNDDNNDEVRGGP